MANLVLTPGMSNSNKISNEDLQIILLVLKISKD